jgi:hypothetical protein
VSKTPNVVMAVPAEGQALAMTMEGRPARKAPIETSPC